MFESSIISTMKKQISLNISEKGRYLGENRSIINHVNKFTKKAENILANINHIYFDLVKKNKIFVKMSLFTKK